MACQFLSTVVKRQFYISISLDFVTKVKPKTQQTRISNSKIDLYNFQRKSKTIQIHQPTEREIGEETMFLHVYLDTKSLSAIK